MLRLAALLLLLALPARAQQAAFTVSGIEVDVAANTAQAAREAGWREAQRKAWPQLWARLTGNPAPSAPRLGDGALDGLVAAVEIERERIGPKRYIARLGVVFDRRRALAHMGGSARILRSEPMLLLPVLFDGGAATLFERRTPWRAAWGRFREGVSPLDYVLAPGTQSDAVLLPAYGAYRPDRAPWRAVLARYDAADVLVAEARLRRAYPGGPVAGRFRALHGPDNVELARFELRADSAAELATMLDAAVRRLDAAFAEALRAGRLRAEESLAFDDEPLFTEGPAIAAVTAAASIEVDVPAPDAETLASYEATIQAAPGVLGTAVVRAGGGAGSRLRIDYAVPYEQLAYNLDQVGLRLTGGALRPRAAGEAPLPPPPTPEELAARAAAAAAAAQAGPPGPPAAVPPAVTTPPPPPDAAPPPPA